MIMVQILLAHMKFFNQHGFQSAWHRAQKGYPNAGHRDHYGTDQNSSNPRTERPYTNPSVHQMTDELYQKLLSSSLYKQLGIPEDADSSVIKQAYRKLAVKQGLSHL